LDDDTVDRGLHETVRRLRGRRRRPISAAIDGTGLSYNSVSTFFVRAWNSTRSTVRGIAVG
jgi:hypothetical protein